MQESVNIICALQDLKSLKNSNPEAFGSRDLASDVMNRRDPLEKGRETTENSKQFPSSGIGPPLNI